MNTALAMVGVAAMAYLLGTYRARRGASEDAAGPADPPSPPDVQRPTDPAAPADPPDVTSLYTRAIGRSLDGLWSWHVPSGALHLSPNWRGALGLPDQDWTDVDTGFFARLHPEDQPAVRAALEAHFERGTPYEIEFRLRDASGAQRWFWARGEAEFDGDGQPTWMSGGISEISERKKAEAALRRADRILRVRTACNLALVHAESEEALLHDACDLAVREGGYLMAWVGFAEEDEEKRVRPAVSAGDDQGYLEQARITWDESKPSGRGPAGRAIRSGQPHSSNNLEDREDFAPWRDAALRRGFASACAVPLKVAGRSIGALMLYSGEPQAFDPPEMAMLTELGNDLSFGIQAKRDARSLAAQQRELALFREAVERSSDAIYVADASTGRFVDLNRTAARQLGYSEKELLKLGPKDIDPNLEEADLWGTLVTPLAAEPAVRRAIHRRKDGTEFPVEVSYSRLESEDRVLVLAIARDISDREAAEAEREALGQQLEQSQKMESVGRLAGGVAHDFNNILTVINATADLIIGELPDDSPLQGDLEQIRAAGDRAAALTRQLLAFSRRQVMHRRSIDLNQIIRDFLELTRRVIGAQIRLEVDLEEGLPTVNGDPGQLEQVLMNLCVNARDAMPRGGTVTISTQRVEVDEQLVARHVAMQTGPHVLLTVRDDGPGMDEATQARVFEPFFTTKGHGKGTGLGLSTVYGIVKQSGGSIWVESKPGEGTRFDIYFPVGAAAAATARAPTAATPRGSEVVLLAERDPAILRLVRRLLENAGYSVITTASGVEALERVRQGRAGEVRLVLADLQRPESAPEVVGELLHACPDLSVLLVTNEPPGAAPDGLPSDGRLHFIRKPYGVQDLLSRVRQALDR